MTLDAGSADPVDHGTREAVERLQRHRRRRNLFSDPTFPTIVVDACAVTISGTVFNDRNENGVPDSASFETRQAWNISLYKKNNLGTFDSAGSTTSDGTKPARTRSRSRRTRTTSSARPMRPGRGASRPVNAVTPCATGDPGAERLVAHQRDGKPEQQGLRQPRDDGRQLRWHGQREHPVHRQGRIGLELQDRNQLGPTTSTRSGRRAPISSRPSTPRSAGRPTTSLRRRRRRARTSS